MKPFAKVSEVKAGTKLKADGDFTCIKENAVLTVEENDGGLFVPCKEGHHYIDGQLDDGDEYTGFWLADD